MRHRRDRTRTLCSSALGAGPATAASLAHGSLIAFSYVTARRIFHNGSHHISGGWKTVQPKFCVGLR